MLKQIPGLKWAPKKGWLQGHQELKHGSIALYYFNVEKIQIKSYT